MLNNLIIKLLWLFPGEFTSSEMAIAGCVLVDRVSEVELFHNASRSEIKVVLDNVQEF